MSLQTIVTKSPLPQKQKDTLLARLLNEGPTEDVLHEIKTALQSFIDSGFKELGAELDQNDPRIQTVNAQFDADVAEAQSQFEEEIENLKIDAAVAQAKANKSMDTIQIQNMKAKMAA